MTIVYIDAQNIFMWIKKLGRNIDREKLYRYLKKKYRFDYCKLFYGYVEENKHLYALLQSFGFELVFKRTSIKEDGDVKWNVDVDIALHVTNDFHSSKLSHCVLLSWDCDYVSIYDFLDSRSINYSVVVPDIRRVSKLLKEYPLLDLSEQRYFLEKKKDW